MPRPKLDTSAARIPLTDFNSTQHVIDAISAANNIIVVSGAGISVSCGIPDFRSHNGIYNTLRCEELNLPAPELLFDSEFFSIDPAPFYKFIRNVFPVDPRPSATHHFIRMLEKKKKLLRNYTQNIDGLESAANINRVVECHGSFSSFKCQTCRSVRDKEACWQDVVEGQVPQCKACNKGVMKPGITFFGDVTPARQLRHLESDVAACDLLIVVGTSLKVGGVTSKILKDIPHHVPQILINMECVTPPPALSQGFDVMLLGAADEICAYLTASLGWGDLLAACSDDAIVPPRRGSASRKKNKESRRKSNELFVTIERQAETHRSFKIRYATNDERLAYESKENDAVEPVKVRTSKRRKTTVTTAITLKINFKMVGDKVLKGKSNKAKRKFCDDDAILLESESEAVIAFSQESVADGTKRKRRVSAFLSRMYVL